MRRFLDALNYWEWARFGFNGVLFAVIVACALFYPASHSYILFYFLELIWIVGVINLIYCIVYPVDLVMQGSAREVAWRERGRFVFWIVLTVFLAVVLATVIIFCDLVGAGAALMGNINHFRAERDDLSIAAR